MTNEGAVSERDALARLLRWYVDMGVDVAVDETPRDRFADDAARRSAPAASTTALTLPARAAPDAAALSQDAVALSARRLAGEARDLDMLRAALEAFDGCALKRTATRIVFSDGDPQAKVMLVGEAPGADEDRQGKPFVGRAGKLLDRMLAAIGLDRTHVYIANVVPWRPPGNRTPTQQEYTACLPFIRRQIALAQPSILVCMGNVSTQALLGLKEGITKARGRWVDYTIEEDDAAPRAIRALATLHPAFLLRSPTYKRQAWADLRALRKAMDAEDD